MKKTILAILILTFSINVSGFANDHTNKLNDTVKYILKTVEDPQVDAIGGEWAVFGLARSEHHVPNEYFNKYYNNLVVKLKKTEGNLHDKKYTEYSRVILALSSIGKDATDVSGYNLVEKITQFDNTVWQGLNGAIYALLALDSQKDGNYNEIKERYLNHIITNQNADGGFSLSGEESDVDITAMALQALAKYKSNEDVKKVIDKALIYISNSQTAQGKFISFKGITAQSICQVVLALCELNINLEDERFIKNGITLEQALYDYYQPSNGFLFSLEGNGESLMATEQSLMALVAIDRKKLNKSSIYSLNDVKINFENKDEKPDNMHKDINKMPVVINKTFTDIVGHANEKAIIELASRQIINGQNENEFAPNNEMTRSEFATIVVKSLGLPIKRVNKFTDVPQNSWFAAYVETAFSYEIINGVSETNFAPEDKITKEQAATMIARAGKLCGLNTTLYETEVKNILAQFDDYKSLEEWSMEPLAFLYKEEILSSMDMEIEPKNNILRCEIAQMLFNLLKRANLC